MYKPGGVAGMPPILASQSAADATVSAPAVVNAFFAKLAPEGRALVAFDINRDAVIEPLLTASARTSWPLDVYSLAHVALPFRPDDPAYGNTPPAHWDFMFLGKIELFGERGVLVVPPGNFARLRHNPLFPLVESCVAEFLAARER